MGVVTVRMYNPEIHTHEKLAAVLLKGLPDEMETTIHPTTIKKIVQGYLDDKGFQISFSDSDHNACVSGK